MRLLSYNIRFGGSRRRELIAGVIRDLDPDVVLLQEATEPDVVDWVGARTRLPLSTQAWHQPRPGRGFLELDSPESPVRILGVHLTAGMTARGERIRIREAERLITLVASAPKSSVVVGDFNSIAPGD